MTKKIAVANEQIPITPEVVTWARERAGYSVQEVAERFPRIAEWESGGAFPTYPQLERMAETFRIPVSVFFFPAPPDLPPVGESFRSLPGASFEVVPRNVRFLLRKWRAMQISLAELCDGRNPSNRLITDHIKVQPDDNLRAVTAQVRTHIGIDLETQMAWASDEDALAGWRASLIAAGVFVFKDAFREEEFSGFCLYDEVFPIIVANNTSAKTRQIFTLLHELAHLLLKTSGIDKIHDNYVSGLPRLARDVEIFCNRFASEFLLPSEAFNAAMAGKSPSEETATSIAGRFHVSREVVFRRLLDRRQIDQVTYDEATQRWNSQRREGGAGGNPYWTKITYLGRDYIRLAFDQFRKNRISEEQLALYLDWKPRNLEALEEYFERNEA